MSDNKGVSAISTREQTYRQTMKFCTIIEIQSGTDIKHTLTTYSVSFVYDLQMHRFHWVVTFSRFASSELSRHNQAEANMGVKVNLISVALFLPAFLDALGLSIVG